LIEAPQAVGTVEKEDLAYRARGTLGDTVSREPGVSTSSFGPGAGRPLIRGQGGERIRVLESGTGSLDVSGISDDHAVPVGPTGLRRVEVLRGPATLRYGARAIGGVVYTEDGRVPEEAHPRAFGGRAGGALGSADDERSGYITVDARSGPWSWRASGFGRRTEDIEIPGFAKSRRQLEAEGNPAGVGEPHGTLPNSYARAYGGSVGVSRVGPRGFVGAAFSAFQTDYGVPNEPDVHIELERYRLDARGRLRYPVAGFESAAWDLAFAHYEHTEFEGADVGTVFEQDAFEGRTEWAHCRWGCVEGAVGLHGSYADLQVTGDEAILPQARTGTGGLFVTERVRWSPQWTLEVGGRYDFTTIDSVENDAFHAFSLAAGLVWSPTRNTSVALSTAYTTRAPTAFELFANGPHVATETFEVGDPDLGLERAFGADLSVRHDGRLVTASVTAFLQHYPSYVGLDDTGLVDAGSGLPIFAYRETEAALYGVEGEAAIHAWRGRGRGVDVLLLGDTVHATDLDTDAPLPRIPPLRLGAGLVYRDARWTARVDWLHAFAQHRTAPNELATDGYDSLDAGISYALPLGCGRSATLRLVGTNLLDEEIRHHTSFIKDLAPERGRSLRLSVEVEF
jgi:iron complex outermembrane receptor protein